MGRAASADHASADHASADHASPGQPLPDYPLAERAVAWYRRAARDLPWRRPDAGPWAVLVSEVMLQQTPVSRVLPVYSKWLRRWPSPSALAADSPGEAIRAWGRLGYPRRALRLHLAAMLIDREHGGHVPDDLDTLRALPGVGAYTAAAIASFAFGRRHPVLDTNVGRLLTRLFADGARPADRLQRQRLDRMLPAEATEAAMTSVALMELGALVCTASNPACERCPLRAPCRSGGGAASGGGQTVPSGGQTVPSGDQTVPSDVQAVPGGGRALKAGYRAAVPVRGVAVPPRAATRRRQPQYRGSVREARGLLLATVRDAPRPVGATALELACPDAARRASALAGLLTDGLLLALPDGTYTLP
ncbi:MAG: A/G-specific adenine glycosylase [Frankiaceae bacterium]